MTALTQTGAMARPAPSLRPVAWWLLVCCGMVAVMVLLGGATRLTGSGLSMTRWQLFTLLPPLTEQDWRAAFAHYQLFPEYRLVNRGMSLDEFKGIFWLEYVHRLWGRLIGAVFLLPFLWFLAQGRIGLGLARRLALLFLLGGLQGFLGWFMVKSGLVDQPSVSHYRLAAHLGLALLIYGLLLWTVLDLLAPVPRPVSRRLTKSIRGLLLLAGLTVLYGAFVAGLDAGLVYNTFPLMNGRLIPENMWILEPVWRNLSENHGTVQWTHRLLALITLAAALAVGAGLMRQPGVLRKGGLGLMIIVLLQAGLGVATLLTLVPLGLGVAHQGGALALLTVLLWLMHQTRPQAEARPVRARS